VRICEHFAFSEISRSGNLRSVERSAFMAQELMMLGQQPEGAGRRKANVLAPLDGRSRS